MQSPLPAPTASGSFVKTPFPHLLVYALERRLSGTFELTQGGAPVATILVVGGCPSKVRTRDAVHLLGNVMLELGMIGPAHLQASLARMQDPSARRLQGQVLLELGCTDQPRLDAALRSQVERKIEHLFALPGDTTFAYYDAIDLLQAYGGPPTPIDPFPVLWRGCREQPALEHVDATNRRIGNALLRAAATAQLERFAFTPQEMQAVESLRHRPARTVDIASMVGPRIGQTLVYFLMIMKQVELIDPAAPASAQTPLAAPPPPSSQNPAPSSPRTPVSSSAAGAQAFARVQLQRQAASRGPLVVEEQVAPSSFFNDERLAPPSGDSFRAQAAPPGAFGGPPVPPLAEPQAPAPPQDIGSMIQQSIAPSAQPSMPPGPAIPAAPNVPHFATEQGSGSDAPPTSARSLTAEHSALRAKVLERSENINSQDYFQMLGIERDANAETVQKAFFALAKVWHPDRLPAALGDVKDACSTVFRHLTEAHTTLMDPTRRQDYMTLLKDGGATPADQQKIQVIIEAATEFQKAEHLLKRNLLDAQAYEIVKRCVAMDPQSDYIATLAWLDAQRPEWQSREKTVEKTHILDACIKKNPNCERAYYYRGLLYKRVDEGPKAMKDFKRAAELNPRNLDAMREVRLFTMRGTKASTGNSTHPSKAPPPAEGLGGLFGKLFKK